MRSQLLCQHLEQASSHAVEQQKELPKSLRRSEGKAQLEAKMKQTVRLLTSRLLI